MNKFISWFDERMGVFSFGKAHLVDYPTPKNLNYWWNFGSLAGICLVLQIVTGILLAMHYKPDAKLAFDSVHHIMRDVHWGWLVRYMHMVGAHFFFIVVYIHIFRGMYYGSYKAPREVLWWMGVTILFLMMATAFLGYVLPWGQMSYWGATVITNLMSVIPVIGDEFVIWLWGGYSVGDPTLNRFFALHYLLPFVICGVVFLHLWALHTSHSNNPKGIDLKKKTDWIPFHPYYTIKDTFGLGVFFFLFFAMVFFAPNMLGHTDNYIPADPLVTPAHIVPEWYFLPFYAILRAIPSKELGVVAMVVSIAILYILPWLDTSKVRAATFRPIYKQMFWIFFLNIFILGWVGAMPPEGIYVLIGRVATGIYFGFFLLLPLVGKLEKPKPVPTSL